MNDDKTNTTTSTSPELEKERKQANITDGQDTVPRRFDLPMTPGDVARAERDIVNGAEQITKGHIAMGVVEQVPVPEPQAGQPPQQPQQ